MIFNQDEYRVLYAHYRKTDGQIFYIGIGTESRPYDKSQRNRYWQHIVDKYDYTIEILQDSLTEERAKELEILTIAFYGRKDKKQGPLVNLTDGGDGGTFAGKDNGMYDNTIYIFENKKLGIIEECTKWELRNKYNISHTSWISQLVDGKCGSMLGWTCLNPKKEFIPIPKGSWMKGKKLSKEHKENIKRNNGKRLSKDIVEQRIKDYLEIEKKRGWKKQLAIKWGLAPLGGKVTDFLNKYYFN